MSNHVHLLASAKDADLSDILRDFKSLHRGKSSPLFRRLNRKAAKTGCSASLAMQEKPHQERFFPTLAARQPAKGML
jgi:hypothetical protein